MTCLGNDSWLKNSVSACLYFITRRYTMFIQIGELDKLFITNSRLYAWYHEATMASYCSIWINYIFKAMKRNHVKTRHEIGERKKTLTVHVAGMVSCSYKFSFCSFVMRTVSHNSSSFSSCLRQNISSSIGFFIASTSVLCPFKDISSSLPPLKKPHKHTFL